MSGCFCHAASHTGATKTTSFTRKCYEAIELALFAIYAREAVRQDAAAQKRLKFFPDEKWNGAIRDIALVKERDHVILDYLIEQRLFWLMAIIGA